MTVRLDASEFNASLLEFEEDLRAAAIIGVEDAAGLLADTWKLHVPVQHGTYRDRIHFYLEEASAAFVSAIVTSGLRQDYDVFLEFGTHLTKGAARLARLHPVLLNFLGWRMRPHPSLRPSIEMTRELLGKAMTEPSEKVMG